MPLYEKWEKQYKEITIENTMKLMIRCKLAFHARYMLINIFKEIISYELHVVELKGLID